MGTACSVLERMKEDLEILRGNIPLNDLDRRAFLNAVDDIRLSIEMALALVDEREDWDVLSFQSFLLQEQERRKTERNQSVVAHLQTPIAS